MYGDLSRIFPTFVCNENNHCKMETTKDINRIKVVLVEKKRTNKWLAEQLGKDPATVSKWCTNTAQPSLETLLEIARVLEVDVKDLLHSTREGIQYIKIQQQRPYKPDTPHQRDRGTDRPRAQCLARTVARKQKLWPRMGGQARSGGRANARRTTRIAGSAGACHHQRCPRCAQSYSH